MNQYPIIPLEKARNKRYQENWKEYNTKKPKLLGNKVFINYPLNELVEYIDWTPFFHGWGLKGKYPQIFDKERVGKEAIRLFEEANEMLNLIIKENLTFAKGIIGIFPANTSGDDIIIYEDESRNKEKMMIPMLRQQMQRKNHHFLALSDFIIPEECDKKDYIGMFAVSTGFNAQVYLDKLNKEKDSYNAVMFRLLLDRLTEAFAEKLHEGVRKEYWGYQSEENLSNEELISENYVGIRPAPGYPACPDHSLKTYIFDLLEVEKNIGIKLSKSYVMNPVSSITGFYIAHPASEYFGIGKINKDQVEDYSRRKKQDSEEIEKLLHTNIAYNTN